MSSEIHNSSVSTVFFFLEGFHSGCIFFMTHAWIMKKDSFDCCREQPFSVVEHLAICGLLLVSLFKKIKKK